MAHSRYKGIGRIPKNLKATGDPAKRILLTQLPKLLQGYARTPSVDAVLVLLDTDKRSCIDLLRELMNLLAHCNPKPKNTLFRLAIEEIEAWYLGDRNALFSAYPKANPRVLSNYVQDAACDTWELLADAIHPGGSLSLKKSWPLPGQIKHEWAEKIGPLMDVNQNVSPSFRKFRDGLRRLIA